MGHARIVIRWRFYRHIITNAVVKHAETSLAERKPLQWAVFMSSLFRHHPTTARSNFRLLILAVFCVSAGCVANNENQAKDAGSKQKDAPRVHEDGRSISALVVSADYRVFQPGRSKTEILNELRWRGNLEMAAEYKGTSISAIDFGLHGGPFSGDGGEIWAIFVDDKFEKFVEPPPGDPAWSERPRIEIGDFGYLFSAAKSKSVTIAELEKEITANPAPSHIDPFLTAVFLAVRPGFEAARSRDLRENTKLRDQFNAARLELGMTEVEVEALFKGKPLRSGEAKSAVYKLYGSAKSLDFLPDLHYSNVLVLFRDGKLSGIYSGSLIPGGDEGVRRIHDGTIELLPEWTRK